jgi:menaquinone-specific isochorismate synthase
VSRRRTRTGGIVAPDPSAFTATVARVAPGRGDDVVEGAADAGHLVGGRSRLAAAVGEAATIELPRGLDDQRALRAVTSWLRAVRTDVEGGTPSAPAVMALGALPFDRSSRARLVVPGVVVCWDGDGATWRVEVRPSSPGPAAPARPEAPGAAPAVVAVPAPHAYERAVAAALAEIAGGVLRKVVLARSLDVHLPAARRPSEVLASLWGRDRAFSPFSVPTPTGRLVGASPELIVARRGRAVLSHPLAGTIALGSGVAHDGAAGAPDGPDATGAVRGGAEDPGAALLGSAKDRAEHRMVVEEVAAVLARRCVDLEVPREPSVVRLRSDARLGTLVRGTLRDAGESTALTLLSLLHPTPAVGGVPREAALKAIAELEPRGRGYWAGVAGWTDARGDGEWVLSIRSVVLDAGGTAVRLTAGAGVVDGSSPARELEETTLKLSPVIDALGPGVAGLLRPASSGPAPGWSASSVAWRRPAAD